MLKLPDFGNHSCYYFEACGKLRGESKRKDRSQAVARVRASKVSAYLRLLEGGEPTGHLHVDIAVTRYFPKSAPEINATRRSIEHAVEKHFGKQIDVLVFAQFVVMLDEINPGSGVVFAGPNAVVSTVNNVAVEVGGAHLVLRNEGFIRSIDWQIFRDDTVFVDISARVDDLTVSESYLLTIFEQMDSSFKTYILGRSSDASQP